MAGRNLLDAAPAAGAKSDLGAAPAAGAKMNKAKMVKIALVSVVAMFVLAAAAVSVARYNGGQLRLRASIDKDSFLRFCVATHVTAICILAWFAATSPTPASRRSYAKATVTSVVQLALNLYLVLVAGGEEVQDAA